MSRNDPLRWKGREIVPVGGGGRGAGQPAVVAALGRVARWTPSCPPELQRHQVALLAALLWIGSLAMSMAIRPHDLAVYHAEAVLAIHGRWHTLLARSYPVGAVAVFVLVAMVPLPFAWAFGLACGIALAVLCGLCRRVPERLQWGRRTMAYLAAGSLALVVGRYDIFAAVCTFGAVESARRGRFAAAWRWSTAGFLLKLFPAVLWPAFVVAQWRAEGRVRLAQLLCPVLGVVAWAVPAAVGAHGQLLHVAVARCPGRPLEVGSLAAGLSIVLHPTTVAWAQRCSSQSVVAGASRGMADALMVGAGLVAGVTLVVLAWGRLRVEQAALVLLTALLLASTIFSAQYLMWVIPLWAYNRVRWQWLAAAIITTVSFPFGYAELQRLPSGALTAPGRFPIELAIGVAFLLRDLLLLWGTAAWLAAAWRAPRPLSRQCQGRAPAAPSSRARSPRR